MSGLRTTDAVDRVALVLDLLADSGDGLRVSEVAEALGVHKATASRLLGTLAARGLVDRAPSQRYRIGVGIVRYAASAVEELGGVSRARPELDDQNVGYRELSAGAGARWQLAPNVAFSASVGWLFDRRFEFDDRNLLLNGDGAATFQISLSGTF